MSTSTKKAARPLTPNEKKTIIIAAICVAMAIILGVSLPLLLRSSAVAPTPDSTDKDDSTLQISNGHFSHVAKDSTTYPQVADSWKLYTYKAPDVTDETKLDEHGFDTVDVTAADAKVMAGVVDVSDWDAVKADTGLTVANPGKVNEKDVDSKVYMISTKEATNMGIASAYFYISAQTSAKITVSLNTSNLKDGSTAFIMLQQYASDLSAKNSSRLAYMFDIAKTAEWTEYTLYVFNRNTSGTQSVCLTVGIGNMYDKKDAEGTLFIDNIDYTTITANDYRDALDNKKTDNTSYKIIGEDEIVEADKYSALTDYAGNPVADGDKFTTASYLELSSAIVETLPYSPFTLAENFDIYRISNDGGVRDTVALVLDRWNNGDYLVVKADDKNSEDHLHIRFWVRVDQANVLAKANIIVQDMKCDVDGNPILDNDGKLIYDKDITNASFTSVVTSQNIVEDNNNGWTKYDIYLKPAASGSAHVLRVVFALGNVNGYASAPYTPNGALYVTSPLVENITATKYNGMSSGSYCKKVNLIGSTSTTSVSNGSFSTIATSSPKQPANWVSAFAGYNTIYKDGKYNKLENAQGELVDVNKTDLPIKLSDASGRLETSSAPLFDDSESKYLAITNEKATSYGYVSTDITLSAKSVYAFSVLAKTPGNLNPYFYVVKNGAESRADAVIGKVESKAGNKVAADNKFGMLDFKEEEASWTPDGWTRYYIVIVTGDKSETVRVALFNGSIDGKNRQQGTVYYDYVTMTNIGTYSIDDAEYEEGDEDAPATNRDRIKFVSASGYSVFEKLTEAELTALANKTENSNVSVHQPTAAEWDKMVEKALEKPEEVEETEEPESTPVNWALLTSVISSVALVGALMIVVVIRMFKRRSKQI